MSYLFYIIIKSIFNFTKDSKIRRFYYLSSIFYKYRNPKNISIGGLTFNIVDYNSFRWQYNEIFIQGIYNIDFKCKNQVIIDCGTNVGTSLLYLSTHYPNSKIIGFEPDLNIYEICKSNLILNKINNVELYNKAIWKHNNGINFSSDGKDGGFISVNTEINNEFVETVRLSEILLKFEKVDFLKMDIEGAEYEVLVDCKNVLNKIDYLFIEYHGEVGLDNNKNLGIILELLSFNKFTYYIENINSFSTPFINRFNSDDKFNMQLNIYAKSV